MKRLTGHSNWIPPTCPPTMNAKGSKLQNFSMIVSPAVHLSTKSVLVMKMEFYAINTVKAFLVEVPLLRAAARSE